MMQHQTDISGPELRGVLVPVVAEFAPFTSAEAEVVAGVTQPYQRDLRRRGHIRSHGGETVQFDVFGLASLVALRVLPGGPQKASTVSRHLALGIAWHALGWTDAFSGLDKIAFSPEIAALIEENAAASALLKAPGLTLEQARAEIDRIGGSASGFTASTKARLMRHEIFRIGQFEGDRPRYFCWWPDGSCSGHSSLEEAFGGGTFDPRYSGSVSVVDMEALGGQLLDAADRPFVHIAYGDPPST
jgi:hypothetical protein